MVKQLVAFLLLFAFTPLAFAEDYKVESIGALTESKITEAVRKAVEETSEVLDVEGWSGRGSVAVGPGVARGEPVEVAGKILHIQDRRYRGVVAVGIARHGG